MVEDKRYQENFLDNREEKLSSKLFNKKSKQANNHQNNSSEPWGYPSSNTPQITMLKDPKSSKNHSIAEGISSIFKTLDLILKALALSLTFIGFITVLLITVMFAAFYDGGFATPSYQLPDQMFIKLDLNKISTEAYRDSLIDELYNLDEQDLLLHDAIKILNAAAKDDRVEGIYANLSETSLGIAQIQELRNAIENFSNAGKETVLFSENMGMFGTGTAEYYLASSFKNINMIPTGEVGLTGLKAEMPFIRTPLDNLGIHPSFSARYEYKTGATTFTDKDFSDVNKEGTEKLVESLYNQITADIARTRGKTIDEVKGLINDGPYSAKEAFSNGLIDNLTYSSDLYDLMEETHPDTSLVQYLEYLEEIEPSSSPIETILAERKSSNATPEIAVLNAFGTILSGESEGSKVTSSAKLGSDTFRRLLYSMEHNENVKAVVIRVDSPGGGYIASDVIRQQIEVLKKSGKPVIISMGNVAASGGYFVSIAGDKIVAEPTTITGSIGVYGGKMVIKDMWEKLGVTWGSVSKGKNAGMASMNFDFTPSQREKFEESLDDVYKDFTQKVSTARKIPIEDMDKIARGRVWTGEQAVTIGLVDELGGLDKAVELAKTALNMTSDDNIKTVRYPKPKTPEEMLIELINTGKLSDFIASKNTNPINILQKYSQGIENTTIQNLTESALQIKYWIEAVTNQSGGLIMNPLYIK